MVVTNRDIQREYRVPRILRPYEQYRSSETMEVCPLTDLVQADNGTDEEYGNHYPRGIATERSRVKEGTGATNGENSHGFSTFRGD